VGTAGQVVKTGGRIRILAAAAGPGACSVRSVPPHAGCGICMYACMHACMNE
jgi:hypothetical protein